MTRGKSESLITPQSAVLLLLEGLLFTQNFMGVPEYHSKSTVLQKQSLFRFQKKTEPLALHSIFTIITTVHLNSIIRTLVQKQTVISRYRFR